MSLLSSIADIVVAPAIGGQAVLIFDSDLAALEPGNAEAMRRQVTAAVAKYNLTVERDERQQCFRIERPGTRP